MSYTKTMKINAKIFRKTSEAIALPAEQKAQLTILLKIRHKRPLTAEEQKKMLRLAAADFNNKFGKAIEDLARE